MSHLIYMRVTYVDKHVPNRKLPLPHADSIRCVHFESETWQRCIIWNHARVQSWISRVRHICIYGVVYACYGRKAYLFTCISQTWDDMAFLWYSFIRFYNIWCFLISASCTKYEQTCASTAWCGFWLKTQHLLFRGLTTVARCGRNIYDNINTCIIVYVQGASTH